MNHRKKNLSSFSKMAKAPRTEGAKEQAYGIVLAPECSPFKSFSSCSHSCSIANHIPSQPASAARTPSLLPS